MSEELANIIEKRHEALVDIKDKYSAQWQSIAKYLAPHLLPLLATPDDAKAALLSEEVYDSAPIEAATIMQNGLVGMTISRSSPWMHFSLGDKDLMKEREIKLWAQNATLHMYNVLSQSNFYDAITSFVFQGITIGPGICFVQEDLINNRIVFSNRHVGECFTALNFYGENDTMHREFKINARTLVQRFGIDMVPEKVRNAYETPGKEYEEFEVLHAVYPESDGAWAKIGKKFASVYKLKGDKEIMSENGFKQFPYSVWNWELLPQETYPRTPAHIALPDIKGLNAMAKTMFRAGEFMADPPLNVPIERKGSVRNHPHGVNYYEDPGRVVTRWTGPQQIPYADNLWKDKKKAVEDHFYVDFFKMLTQLTQRMTGLEVMERQSEKVALVGVPTAKFMTQGLDAMLERAFYLEYEAGRLPEPPQGIGGEELKIVYTGPLAVLQKRLAQGQQITRALAELAPVFQQFPESANKINWNALVEHLLDVYDFPVESIKTERELKAEAAAQAEMQQKQMAMQEQEVMGKALPGMAKAQQIGAEMGQQ